MGEGSVQDGWCGGGGGDCGNHLIVHARFPTFPTVLHHLRPSPHLLPLYPGPNYLAHWHLLNNVLPSPLYVMENRSKKV